MCVSECVSVSERWAAMLNRMVKKGPTERVTSEEKPEGGEEGSIVGRGNNKGTDLEIGACLVWNSKKVNVGEAE